MDEHIPVVNVLTDEEIAASVKRTDDCESQQAGVNVSDSEDDVLQHVRKYFALILSFFLLSQPLIISQLANFKLQNK